MRNLLKTLSVFLTIGLFSCSDNYNLLNDENEQLLNEQFKKTFFSKQLDVKYGFNDETIEDFTDNLIFDDKGRVVGAMISKIKKNLDDTKYKLFLNDLIQVENTNTPQTRTTDPKIFQGYKPKPRGCKKRNNWICVIYGDIVQ